MYDSKVRINSTIEKEKRVLKESDTVLGECDQIGISEGKDALNPTAIDSLAIFDCNLTFNNFISEDEKVKVTKILLIKRNGDDSWNEQLFDDSVDGSVNKEGWDIVPDDDPILNEATRLGRYYTFYQTEEKIECNCNGKETNLILNGKVGYKNSINDEQYDINISGKDETCTLKKVANEINATSTLTCTINEKMSEFSITDLSRTINNTSTIYLILDNRTGYCSIEEDDTISGNYKKKSSGGISAGTIVAIAVPCFIILLIIIIFISKKVYDKASQNQTLSGSSRNFKKRSYFRNDVNIIYFVITIYLL